MSRERANAGEQRTPLGFFHRVTRILPEARASVGKCEPDNVIHSHVTGFSTLRTVVMFEPIRGGTRGGQAEFKWSDVSADKDREVRVSRRSFFIPTIIPIPK